MVGRFKPLSLALLAAFVASVPTVLTSAESTGGAEVAIDSEDEDWSSYGGDAGGTRFSDLIEITRDNVARLQPVWTYRTGELGQKFARADKLSFEATPIFVGNSLYLS